MVGEFKNLTTKTWQKVGAGFISSEDKKNSLKNIIGTWKTLEGNLMLNIKENGLFEN